MVEKIYKELEQGKEVRQNISKLRQLLKENIDLNSDKLLKVMNDDCNLLLSFLLSEDAKTRKNAALLMGDLGNIEFLDPIFSAYESEEQLFVKSSYLKALQYFDYRNYIEKIKDRLETLTGTVITAENKKHITEEIRGLTDLVLAIEGIKEHCFTGYRQMHEMILLTNRRHIDVTMDQLELIERLDQNKCKIFNAGIQMKADCLEQILPIRTYQEVLFIVKGLKTCNIDPIIAAKQIAESKLLEFLESTHEGESPFYFRVEYKSKLSLDKKSSFSKKLASELERLSGRTLINSTSNYEVEIRLIETTGKYLGKSPKNSSLKEMEDQIDNPECNLLIKLHTIPDDRFDYRQEMIANSIKPVNAALLVELAKDYMIDDAQVLDPFCGVGTMLIERQKQVKANTSYGIDYLSDAITKGKRNTLAAGQIIHYVNKDFFDFQHDYLFDEIFTNMPFKIGRKTEEEIYALYERFFSKAKKHLAKEGTIIMYTHDKDFVMELAPIKGFRIIKEFEIMPKEGTHLFILK